MRRGADDRRLAAQPAAPCAEHKLAVELGLPIFYDTVASELHNWVVDWKRTAKEAK